MVTRRAPSWLVPLPLCAALAGTACHEQRPDAPPTPSRPSAAAASAAPTPPPAPAAPPAPSAPPGCAAPLSAGPATPVKVGDLDAVRSGSQLTFSAPRAGGALTFGVLGPVNEDSGANLVALQKYLAFFKSRKADAIVVTGDSGETSRGITRVLDVLAAGGLPVFVVIGNSECAQDYVDGVAAAQKEHSNVVNLDEVRVVSFPEATLVSLPGHHDANFLHCTNGCLYTRATVDEVVRAAKEAKSPVVLISHGPPHGEGTQALDFTPNSGGNVGNPDIQRAIHEGNIPYGFFSNIKEAGARATDASGSTVIPQDSLAKSLFLNPGPASTDPWKMNDGQMGHGFAALFTVGPQGARWTLFRNPPLSKAEKAKAKALQPKPDESAKD